MRAPCAEPGCERPPKRAARRTTGAGFVPRYCHTHGTDAACSKRYQQTAAGKRSGREWARGQRRSDAYLQKRYGITTAEYEALLVAQDGVCAICARPPKGHRLCVDHRHDAKHERREGPRGLVRGLLCWMCNYMLVNRHMTSARLEAAAAYLSHPPAPEVLRACDRANAKLAA